MDFIRTLVVGIVGLCGLAVMTLIFEGAGDNELLLELLNTLTE